MIALSQRGEATVFALFSVVTISGILLIVTLELRREFQLLQRRTQIFLCAKEARISLVTFISRTGQANWGIRNVKKAALLMAFIPGLQGAALNVQRLKELLKIYQQLQLASYLKNLSLLSMRSCPLDPKMYITPFELGPGGFRRRIDGTVPLRRKKWTYVLRNSPYALELEFRAADIESLNPRIGVTSRENGVRSSWPLP